MSAVDFGRRSGDYAEHRPGFPPSFFDRLSGLRPIDGLRALDLGTGPGIVALELAERGATVTGIDIAPNQIEAARSRAAKASLSDRCRFAIGHAEQLDFADASFDLVTAGQCWHWFDETATLTELMRVLRPGGLLVVAHYSYLALHSELAEATEDLILQFNPSWSLSRGTGLYPEYVDPLLFAGFALVEQFCYDHDRAFSHAGWRGRMRTCNGVGSGGLPEDDVVRFDAALAELLRARFPAEPLSVRHRVWATVAQRRPS